MKQLLNTRFLLALSLPFAIALPILLLGGLGSFETAVAQEGHAGEEMQTTSYDSLYVCAMHPWEAAGEQASCTLCGMKLSLVEGHEPGTAHPGEDELFVNPEQPLQLHEGAREGWIPITESPYYEPREQEPEAMDDHSGHDHEASGSDSGQEMAAAGDDETLWTCGMHPEVIQDEPGICPICQMDLTPLKQASRSGGATVTIDPVTRQNIGVRTAPVRRRDLARSLRSNGTVEVAEENEVKLNARTGGWVERLHVARTGERVRAGQPLVELYSPELLAAQEELLQAARSSTGSGGQLLSAAKRRLALWNIPEDQVEQILATGQVRRSLTLTAPRGGIVLEKKVVEGASVKAGQDLFTIADLSRVWVQVQLFEMELPWVREGAEVLVHSPYDPGFEARGVIDYIYPTLDPATRSVLARVVLANDDRALKPGMYVQATISTQPRRNVIAVPGEAVLRSGKRNLVFVESEPGVFEPREVHLGVEAGRYIEITHNLEAGEEVVVSGQFLIDSEAKLAEAIQRRIEKTRSGGETAGAATGHQH